MRVKSKRSALDLSVISEHQRTARHDGQIHPPKPRQSWRYHIEILESIDPSPVLSDDISLLDRDTLGYWSFDETIQPGRDESIQSNDGTLMGSTVAAGYSGNAFQGDGNDGFVELSRSFPDATELTIAAWVYHEGGADPSTILSDGTPDVGSDLVFSMNDTQLGVRADKDGMELDAGIPPGALTGLDLGGSWHHLTWILTPAASILSGRPPPAGNAMARSLEN